MKQLRDAEGDFKRSLEKKADFFDSAYALGLLYEKQKRWEQLVLLYKQFQRENGPQIKMVQALSQYYLNKQEYDLALDQLKILEESDDDAVTVKLRISLIYVEQKKHELAILKLKEAMKLAPDSDKIRYYLAAVYEELKRYPEAVQEFENIPLESSFFSEAVVHAAFLYKEMGKPDKALSVLESGLKKKKDVPQMYALYVSLLDEKGQYEKALTVLNEGLERFVDHVQLLFYYGTINDRLGKKDLVLNTMKKVIQLDNKNIQAMNYLAYTYADLGQNLTEAEALARKALGLNPEDGFIMDTLGWVLYREGRVKESVTWLEAAQRNQPKESIIAEHLGDAYAQSRLFNKAKVMYQRAVEMEIDESKQNKIKEKVSAIDSQETQDRIPASIVPKNTN
jgi:tetratricopeptide (TPR) repeat protein